MNTTLYILLVMTVGGVLYFSLGNSTPNGMSPSPAALQSNQPVKWETTLKNNDMDLLLTTKIISGNNIKGYYAEYTLASGRKICGQLSMPGPGGTFQTHVNFNDSIQNIVIYSDEEYYSKMNL